MPRILHLFLASILLATLLPGTAPAEDRGKLVLTPVREVRADDIIGPTHRMFFEPRGKGWLILFRSAEVASHMGLGDFSGVWLADEGAGQVKVFRFDTGEGVSLSLFSAPGLSEYVLGYRKTVDGPWNFLFPEKDVLQNPALVFAALDIRH